MSGYTRGGLWTNAEDEILKAAVSKYGLSQWSRCLSLLNRKTAKQCKARWYSWLSPEINKSSWTPQEDERLLELAKVLPNQWQTIAPLVGRSPHQCIERYQKLFDDLQGDSDIAAIKASDSTEAMGAIEAKPAKPDAVEMDEDEQEMISEAKARLANTMGKKAKRKQRERILAQTRRLALLQKRRDMKNAGINVGTSLVSRKKRKMGGMDYNADIPFEMRPQDGLYDTTEEDKRDRQKLETFQNKIGHVEKPDKKKKEKKPEKKQGLVVEAPEKVVEDVLVRKRDLKLPGIGEQVTTGKELRADRMKKLGLDLIEQQKLKSLLAEGEAEEPEEASSQPEENKNDSKERKKIEKEGAKVLKKLFATLPEPKNDFEIAIPEVSDEDEPLEIKHDNLGNTKTYTVRPLGIERGLEIPHVESKSKTLRKLAQIPVPKYALEATRLVNKELVSLAISEALRSGILAEELENLKRDPSLSKDLVPDMRAEERDHIIEVVESSLDGTLQNLRESIEKTTEEAYVLDTEKGFLKSLVEKYLT